jgi:hypothetical protein
MTAVRTLAGHHGGTAVRPPGKHNTGVTSDVRETETCDLERSVYQLFPDSGIILRYLCVHPKHFIRSGVNL